MAAVQDDRALAETVGARLTRSIPRVLHDARMPRLPMWRRGYSSFGGLGRSLWFGPEAPIPHRVTRKSDPIQGEQMMTVYAELYPSGETDVVVEGMRSMMSPIHALALAAALQATAGPLVDHTGAVVSTRPA